MTRRVSEREAMWRARATDPASGLVLALLRVQQRRRETDAAFAAFLGVTQPTWTRTVNGDRPVGLRLLSATARRLPRLTGRVVSFLRSDIPIGDGSLLEGEDA